MDKSLKQIQKLGLKTFQIREKQILNPSRDGLQKPNMVSMTNKIIFFYDPQYQTASMGPNIGIL